MVDFYGEGDRIGESSDYEAVTVEPSGTQKVTVEGKYGVANPKYITKAYQDCFHVPETIIHTNDPVEEKEDDTPGSGGGMTEE